MRSSSSGVGLRRSTGIFIGYLNYKNKSGVSGKQSDGPGRRGNSEVVVLRVDGVK